MPCRRFAGGSAVVIAAVVGAVVSGLVGVSPAEAQGFRPARPVLGVPVPVARVAAAAGRGVRVSSRSVPAQVAVSGGSGSVRVVLPAMAASAGGVRTAAAGGGVGSVVSSTWRSAGAGVSVAAARLPGGSAGPVSMSVQRLSVAAARARGLAGPALLVSVADSGRPVPVGLRVADAVLAGSFGADYARRVRWVEQPASGPDAGAAGAVSVASASVDGATVLSPLVGAGPMLVAAVGSGTASDGTGSFGATPLRASSSWQVSAQSGDFSWDYPLPGPPAPAGAAPQVGLSYDSQSVDGETGSTNNQPSVVGEGWSVAGGGSIARTFEPCAASDSATGPIAGSGDLCWVTDNATVSFAGHSSSMVKDSAGGWRLADDDNTRVEYLTGAVNGTSDGDYWRLTTADGTQYYFGLDRLPGWVSGDASTNSAWTVPVCGTPSVDCHGAAGSAGPFSTQAWQWNLDYVVDPDGNAQGLYYTTLTNRYAENGTGSVAYVRAGELKEIDYGLRSGELFSATAAAAKVTFSYAQRCETGQPNEPADACDPASPVASYWPDVPWDQSCTSTTSCTQTSPSFFSSHMLASVRSYVLAAGAYAQVNLWKLSHSWPDPGDGTSAALWLTQIDHTAGTGTGAIATPATVFTGTTMQNRVWVVDGLAPLDKWRISAIETDSGANIVVAYSPQECTPTLVASLAPQHNTHRCYPAWWTPQTTPAQPAQLDWFHKYVVTQVVADPGTGGDGDDQQVTSYLYTGSPGWRFDDSPGVLDSQRSWGQWAGYSSVEVRTGDPNTPAGEHTVDYTFFQGLDGDPDGPLTSPTSSTYTASQLVASDGTTATDSRWFAGRVFETVVRDGASAGGGVSSTPVVSDTVAVPWASAPTASSSYSYSYTDPADGTVYSGTLTQSARHTDTATTKTISPLSSGGNRTVTTTVLTRDGYGQPLTVESDTADAGDSCTRTSYVSNTSAWLIDLPATVSTLGQACDVSALTVDDIVSGTATGYDGGAVGETPTVGHPTVSEQQDGVDAAGNPSWQTVATMGYDALGRLTSSTDPRTTSDGTTTARTTTTSYTPAGGGPLTQVATTTPVGADAVGTTTSYDPAFGVPTSVVDQNQDTTTASYDALGRLVQVWLPNRPQAANPTSPSVSYAYTLSTSVPETIATTALIATGGTATSYQLFDGLGRARQTQSPAEGGGIDLVDTFYDAAGQPYLSTAPYYATGSPSTALLVPTLTIPSKTQTDYDGAGRVTATITVGNSGETAPATASTELWRTSTAYPGADRVDVIPPAGGVPSSTFTDSRGRTTALTQWRGDIGAIPETTTYAYYPSGRLESMTDPTGANTWSWTYDGQGHPLTATDPDTGTTSNTYWPDGDLKTTHSSRTYNHYFTYDVLDRKTAEYTGTSSAGAQLATWSYDQASITGTSYRAVGLPSGSTAYVGGTAGQPGTGTAYSHTITSYDTLGHPTAASTTIGGSTALAGSYATSYGYAPDGSPKTQTDPAEGGLPSETLTEGFDSLGNQDGLSSALAHYLSGVTYTHLNQLGQTFQFQGAEQWRTYTWDPQTLRLEELFDQRYASANATVSDDTYSYTDAGTLTEDSNRTEAAGTDTQCYSYNLIGDLTAAWTPASNSCATTPTNSTVMGGPAPYWTSWVGNATTGNRTSVTTRALNAAGTVASSLTATYSYPAAGATPGSGGTGTGGPHAVATISYSNGAPTDTYSYDPDGDTTALPGHTITYDTTDHPKTQKIAGVTETDIYDADGNLLLQSDPTTGATAYLGDTQLHAAAGSSTITGSRTYTFNGQPIAERDTTAGTTGSTLYFTDSNTQNTITALLNTTTAAVTTRRYLDPYGNPRTPTSTWPNPTTNNHSYLNAPQDLLTTTNSTTTDPTTQLGARTYDPTLGRFLTVDPLLSPVNPQQNNGYSYAWNNPVTYDDPSGLTPCMMLPASDRYGCEGGGSLGATVPKGSQISANGPSVAHSSGCDYDCVLAGIVGGGGSGDTAGSGASKPPGGGSPDGGKPGAPGSEIPMPGPRLVGTSGWLNVDDVINDPSILQGMNPDDLLYAFGGMPQGFKVSAGTGTSVGPGWKILGWGDVRIQWMPGSKRPNHLGGQPYWYRSSGATGKSDRIPGGSWDNGPEEYTGKPPQIAPPNPPAGPGEGGEPCACGGPRIPDPGDILNQILGGDDEEPVIEGTI
jgi:RHS repeat-associated protein